MKLLQQLSLSLSVCRARKSETLLLTPWPYFTIYVVLYCVPASYDEHHHQTWRWRHAVMSGYLSPRMLFQTNNASTSTQAEIRDYLKVVQWYFLCVCPARGATASSAPPSLTAQQTSHYFFSGSVKSTHRHHTRFVTIRLRSFNVIRSCLIIIWSLFLQDQSNYWLSPF